MSTPQSASSQPTVSNLDGGNYFPSGPPAPPPSSTPPPLAASGRWLHSAVLINGIMWIYGGVGSYSSALYNDVWVYDFVEAKWAELQASFIPPFPVINQAMAAAQSPEKSLDNFVPDGMPRQSAFTPPPETGQVLKPLDKKAAPSNPIAVERPERPKIPLVELAPLPRSPFKAAGYSFLEESVQVRMEMAHKMTIGSTTVNGDVTTTGGGTTTGNTGGHTGGAPKKREINEMKANKMSPFIAADLWSYSLDSKLWNNVRSSSSNIPVPRWLHTAVSINNAMIVFGGVSYSDIILGDVWVFQPVSATWVKAVPQGDPILPREGHSACVFNDRDMVVFGGISYGHLPFNDLWIYGAETNTWELIRPEGTAPPPRWLHTAVSKSDGFGTEKMFVFGGVTRNWVPLDDLYIYDRATNKWSHPRLGGNPPFPRMLHTAAVIHNKMFILGGIANNIPLEDMWTYDIAKNEWTEEVQFAEYPFAREGHTMVVVEPPPSKYAAPQPYKWKPMSRYAPLVDPLTPLIKNYTTERPRDRYRKEANNNRWLLVFGGAGPKPRYDQP